MEDAAPTPPPPRPVRWRKRVVQVLFVLVALFSVAVMVFNSPIGHRFVAERIAHYAPASGLRITVGRIEGSLYREVTLRDVAFSDPQGEFLRVPEIELDWRPFNWFYSGLDVRRLVARRGTLRRLPKLRPGDPDAPLLPDFDIRVDHLEIDGLKVATGVLGEERRIGLLARVDILRGRALIRADGRLGGKDRLFALLDAAPARDRFDLRLDYAAPKGGLLAGLAGAKRGIDVQIAGKGGWRHWDGALLAREEGRRLAALHLRNRAGRYALLGQVWPGGLLKGMAARVAGDVVSLDATATLADSVLDGRLGVTTKALRLGAVGAVDLAGNRFRDMRVQAALTDPGLPGGGLQLEGARLSAKIDGPFRELQVEHTIVADRLTSGKVRIERLATSGTATYDGARWILPLDLTAARIVTGSPAMDPRLVNARVTGRLALAGARLSSDDLAIGVPGLGARLALRGDTARGSYGLAGSAAARGWPLPDLGIANADAKLVIALGNARASGGAWSLRANFAGRMARVDNATLTTVAGDNIRLSGGISLGSGRPLLVERARLDASKLTLTLSGHRSDGGLVALAGSGRHANYGPFSLVASIGKDGPRGALVFASPWPAGGLKNVRIALAPVADGFRIETEGDSTLGPFKGTLGLFARKGSETRLAIERMQVWKTDVTGGLLLGKGGVTGRLQLAGGGLGGTIGLEPRGGGQGLDLALTLENAQFGGETPIAIGKGKLEASGFIARDHTTMEGNAIGQGISYGNAFFGRMAVQAKLADGRGQGTASLAGRRGSRFNLQLTGDFAPGRLAVLGHGDFAGRGIAMPRRAVVTREDNGWRLAPAQVNFGGGRAIASGLLGSTETELKFGLADMPLSIVDVLVSELGLGGTASGLVEYRHLRGDAPSGSARLVVKGLTRSGLVLASRPIDLALVGELSPHVFEARAVLREGGNTRGRAQARISGLPQNGNLGERLRAGHLVAQLRYAGPADTLWRLIALEAFDLTGPITIAADASGSIPEPQIRGTLSSDALRLQSALTGTDISNIAAEGRFAGARLEVASFTGRTPKGGQISGSGSFDLSGIGVRGTGMDLRIAAQNARVLARDDMAATVTGPLRIISDGVSGTIAGRVSISSALWRLGRANVTQELPDIATRETNRRIDSAPRRVPRTTWRYMIDAKGSNRIAVRGLGLDSEWSADIRLRGTTHAPTIMGVAELVRGGYDFAGKRFELIRGRINFDGNSPPDPRLDILAGAEEDGLAARVAVRGTSFRPEITFSSVPALPEEELLSRLLFGNSVSDISAPEALQLGAALASLRGGGGIDPINRLRSAIGLDRLRIVGADASAGRETSIAMGKYIGRRLYAEIVTDGRGYSATELEFRVTSWLSLLATMSSIGRESMNVRVSKDY